MSLETPFTLKVRLHISENMYRHDYDISELCKTLKISRSQIYRKLKAQTGKTFSNILTEARIRKACLLLENMDSNISEIAFTLGFKDPSYFVKVFKKQMGMTPGKYKVEIFKTRQNSALKGSIV